MNHTALIAAKLKQYPQKTDEQIVGCLKRHGVRVAEVRAVRAGQPVPLIDAGAVALRPRARNLAEFRRAHDIPQKIRTHLAGMSSTTYVTEEELRQLCEVAVQDWRRNAELPEFAPFKFKHAGVTYWAPLAAIKEMKRITGRA